MFGNMYPLVGHETIWSDRIRDRAFADYVRWEYRPSDRFVVVAAARGAAGRGRRRPRLARSPFRRLRAWASGLRAVRPVEAAIPETVARD